VLDQDRFGRFDPIEGGYWIKPFRDAGIKLVTVAQGVIDWSDFQGRCSGLSPRRASTHFYGTSPQRAPRAPSRAVRAEWQGGPAPFGYMLEPIPDAPPRRDGRQPKRLVPHPEYASIMRKIFEDYGRGQRVFANWPTN